MAFELGVDRCWSAELGVTSCLGGKSLFRMDGRISSGASRQTLFFLFYFMLLSHRGEVARADAPDEEGEKGNKEPFFVCLSRHGGTRTHALAHCKHTHTTYCIWLSETNVKSSTP